MAGKAGAKELKETTGVSFNSQPRVVYMVLISTPISFSAIILHTHHWKPHTLRAKMLIPVPYPGKKYFQSHHSRQVPRIFTQLTTGPFIPISVFIFILMAVWQD